MRSYASQMSWKERERGREKEGEVVLTTPIISDHTPNLHVSIFDPIVYHLDVMSRTIGTYPVTAWLLVDFSRNTLREGGGGRERGSGEGEGEGKGGRGEGE